MKTINTIYTDTKKLQDFFKESNLKSNNLLVQVFTSSLDENYIRKVVQDIEDLTTDSTIIGTTTAGEIINGEVEHNSTVLSFTSFESTSIKSTFIDEDTDEYFEMGISAANQLITDNTKALILFSDTIHADREELLKGIESVKRDIVVSGGVAGDNFEMCGGKIFLGQKIISTGSGLVGVSLNSDHLNVHTTYSLGWQEIGKLMEVTKSDKSRVYTLDCVPAFEMYKKYLGDEVSDNLMDFSGAEFPIVINRNGVKIAREALTKNDDKSIIYSGKLYEGEKIQFAYGNVNFILQNIENITRELENISPESIFIYSCAARKAFLKEDIISEIKPISKFANTAGFFTYGEFFHLNNRNETLNMTMTMLCLSESPFKKSATSNDKTKTVQDYYDSKSMANIRTLTHLVKTVTNELEEKNKILEDTNQKILESINYAKKIQSAILPNKEGIDKRLPYNFIIWRPRDIVGGDLYWYKEVDHKLFVAVIDCTGHGVPGAFMTMMANSILHHIIDESCNDNPSKILQELNSLIKRTLQKDENYKEFKKVDDGLDIGLCLIDPEHNKLTFSGAKISLFYNDGSKAYEIRADKQSIGYKRSKEEYTYTNHEITLNQNMTFYMTSDGLIEQNGNKSEEWFGKKRFFDLVANCSKCDLEEQRQKIVTALENHMGNEAQRDDITVIGFRI